MKMMESNEICGKCRYHKKDKVYGDYICVERDSEYAGDFTPYNHSCNCFESWEKYRVRNK